jgi:4-amino-4-deoxy-L-arabinose transferase-like glycosyltransferase
MPQENRNRLLLALIVLGALAVRLYGLDWGLPYHFHSDERILMVSAEQIRSAGSVARLPVGNSQFFIYPPLLMHIWILFAAPVFRFVGFKIADPGSATLAYVIGRGISAAFGSATVVLVYLLGKRAYSSGAGLLGAAFLAFSVLHVRDSHFFTTDVAMTFFLVLLMLLALRIAEGADNRLWVWTGVVTGLAVAAKPTVLIFSPVLLLAHSMGTVGGGSGLRALRDAILSPAFWKPLLLLAAVAGATLVVMDPYPLLAPKVFLAMTETQAHFVKGAGQRNWIFQFTGTTVLYWFTNLLWFGMGPLLQAAGLLGAIWAAGRRRRADVLILAFVVLYLGTVGRGFMKYIRYALPLLPFLALLAGRMLVELHERARGAARLAVRAAGAAVLLSAVALSLAYLNIYRVEDARVLASRWIHQNIPAKTTVVADNSQTTPLFGELFTRPGFFDNYILCLTRDDCVRDDFVTLKVMNMKSYASRSLNPPERFEAYVRERLSGAEYVVTGDEFLEQYEKRERDYPAVVRFYRDLYAGRLGFQEVQSFKTRPSLFGFEWNDDGAELTWRMFDHPRTRIFRRVAPPPAPSPG